MHVVEEVAEVAAEYVPAGQTAQSARVSWLPAFTPLSLLNVPAGQLVHDADPVVAAKVPAGHTVQRLAAEPEYVPIGQAVQSLS